VRAPHIERGGLHRALVLTRSSVYEIHLRDHLDEIHLVLAPPCGYITEHDLFFLPFEVSD
jgi:hypothetical protein